LDNVSEWQSSMQ